MPDTMNIIRGCTTQLSAFSFSDWKIEGFLAEVKLISAVQFDCMAQPCDLFTGTELTVRITEADFI